MILKAEQNDNVSKDDEEIEDEFEEDIVDDIEEDIEDDVEEARNE
jgi:cobalamin-dependent methionine synthase I